MAHWSIATSLVVVGLSLGSAVSPDITLLGRTKAEMTVEDSAGVKCHLRHTAYNGAKTTKSYRCGKRLITLTEKLIYSEVKIQKSTVKKVR